MESPGPSLLGNQVEGSAVSMTTSGLKKVDGNKMKWPPGTMGYHPIVLNGLQLSLRRQKQAFAAYNYASLDLPAKIDWKVLAGEELECQHIRYHQLQPNDNLTALTTTIKTSHAVGVVFANVEDNTELPSQFSLGTNESSNSKKINFPIILISSSDGAMLQESLNHHDVGEINAKIEIKNQSDVKLLRRTCMLPIQSECAASPGKSGSLIPGLRSSSRRGIEINLKELVKTLMLHVDGVQCVSDDLALFQHLITAFYQYEQMAEREVPQTDGGVFRKLSKHMEHMFEKDFPFYVTIAYRVHKKQQYYACDELSPFVQNCALKFERLPPKVIAETLKTFLTRDNFRVMVEPNSTPTVFEVLEESCIQMMVYSANLRSQESSSKAISHRQLYYSMIWISVACKCHVERGSRVIVNYWREHLTSKHKMIYLNSDSIHSIRRGMEFGYMLELPRSVAFAGECMAELLAAEGTVRSFRQIRECAVVLEQCFTEEEDFVMNLVRKPRLCYQAYFSQSGENKLRYLHPDGNLLVILQEGLLFLDSVLGIIRKRLWQSTQLEEEMKKWLSILLSLVDITSTHAESYLKDFLTTKSGGVTKLFREHIKRGVISKVQKNISKLNVEQFFELYQAFLIWPTWLVEQYLHQYHIPPDVKISSLGWRNLFSEFVDRFDSHHHKSLLEFLKCVGSSYQTQGRATDFVLDLLVLDVPSLFMADCDISTSTLQSDILAGSVSDNFYTFLSEFIQRNNLRTPILERVKVVWESLVEHSDFQQIILNVLQEELIPESSVLKDAVMTQPSIRLLIDHCVTMICQRIGSLREIKSRTHFCWGLLASCCRRIPISDTFEWVHLFTFIIDQLGRVYGMYCEFHGLSEEGISLVGGDLPSDVVESPCEEVPYVFQWVYRVQSLLAEWSQKFSSRKINYDAIQLYYNNFSNITRVSTLFYANAALIDMQSLVAIKADFNQNFELLNMFMIRYVPEKIDLGWYVHTCT
jgi:hypothetical protein